MKKLLLSVTLLLAFLSPAAHAEFVNDFNCTLNKGYTVQQLFAFQQSWMEAARKHDFSEAIYKTRIWFPVYAEVTTTDPMYFVWRGSFKDSVVLGRMLDWFPSSEWAGKFNEVMNCSKATLWAAP
jgi:hypothetical protein